MHRWRLAQVFFVLCAGGMMVSAQPAVPCGSGGVKTVLVLYGERDDWPAIRALEENLRQVFHSSVSPKIVEARSGNVTLKILLSVGRFDPAQMDEAPSDHEHDHGSRCAGRISAALKER